ncbi:FAD-linked oxidase-like C-terminal [Arabidopsis suecica]|uniref:cytokinin dehydrogenase n=1 Tax=Arabidopsis suecica TaxID=45249 RepID=A0A8T2BC69_ARASU|nr:FAD-linked oxidase-like C-terminal [Arabidopsis suecica]
MANLRLIITLITVLICLFSSFTKSSNVIKIYLPKSLNLTLSTDPSIISAASHDFGNITTVTPGGVICPSSSADISRLLHYAANGKSTFQVAARGQGHSLNGQASVSGGVIVNMTCLNDVVVSKDKKYADVAAGTLWVDVFKKTAEEGVSPVSWTDYLHITVGGTLSNGGIGGQVFRNGPLISNVLELDVITGKGEVLTCSRQLNPELFYGVLGGLGQFGIITRARIVLDHAPKRAKWFRMLYSDFTTFTKDQERLISMANDIGVDYLEGQIFLSNGVIDTSFFPPSDQSKVADLVKEHGVIYVLEVAKYYDDPNLPIISKVIDTLTKSLSYLPGFISMHDVSYFDFLNRVQVEENKLRSLGLWEVPHPWLNLYVPKSRILDFHNGVIKDILLKQKSASGLALLYPTNRNKWDNRMSAMIPETDEDVIYIIGLLQSATPQNLPEMESVNEEIIRFCKDSGIKIKQYLMHYTRKEDWIEHFGSKWDGFSKRKDLFDPKKLLSPGQDIF